MAVVTPPLFLSVDGVYTAARLGLPYRDIISEGVVASGDLEVSERGVGANLSVDIAAGACWVLGDTSAIQPVYRARNDATVNLAVSGGDVTHPRKDLVVARVYDSAFSGVTDAWALEIVEGTPAASPAEPTVPDSALVLAMIDVAASETSIADGDITDRRSRAQVGAGAAAIPRVTALPQNPKDGQEIYFVASVSDNVVWHLRYHDTDTTWEVIGDATPLRDEVDTSETTTSTSFAALTTAGPSITLPAVGDYIVEIGAQMANSSANQLASMSYDIGGSGAVDADELQMYDGVGNGHSHNSRSKVKTGLGAVALVSKYKVSGGSGRWSDRYMLARPLRLDAV